MAGAFTDFTETMVMGDDHLLTLQITTLNTSGQVIPVDLTSWLEFWFQVKEKPKDPDTSALVALTKTGGGVVLNPASQGICQMLLPRASILAVITPPPVPDGFPVGIPRVGRKITLYCELAGKDPTSKHVSLKQGLLVVNPYLVEAG